MWFLIWFVVLAAIIVPKYGKHIEPQIKLLMQGSPQRPLLLSVFCLVFFIILGRALGLSMFLHLFAAISAWLVLFSVQELARQGRELNQEQSSRLMEMTRELHTTQQGQYPSGRPPARQAKDSAAFSVQLPASPSWAVPEPITLSFDESPTEPAISTSQLGRVRLVALLSKQASKHGAARGWEVNAGPATKQSAVGGPAAEPPPGPAPAPPKPAPGFTYQPQLIQSRFGNTTGDKSAT